MGREEEGGEGNHQREGLIVGSYCHDVLYKDDVVIAHTLGGAPSFISTVLDSLSSSNHYYASKVGPDFSYTSSVLNHPPAVHLSSPTTLFHAHFSSSSSTRVLRRVRSCDPILPSDLPHLRRGFHFGMAVGVAGEILPETLEKMLDICDLVFADAQSLIRTFDDGIVKLGPLKESGFFDLIPRLGFLKASAEEAPYVDVDEARKHCCVVVTNGEEGCSVYWKDEEQRIPPFPTVQLDPTGAGDSFLGGFVAGLVQGLSVPDAALLGNLFGSLTVGYIGIPTFHPTLIQRVKEEIHRRKAQTHQCSCGGFVEIMKQKQKQKQQPLLVDGGHDVEEFHVSLAAAVAAKHNFNPSRMTLQEEKADGFDPDLSHQHNKLLVSPVFDEPPIQSLNNET